jgi:hypothetical protein
MKNHDKPQSEAEISQENVELRDAVESLAKRLVTAAGKKPDMICKGLPLWLSYLPERTRKIWKRGAGGGRGVW